jgi:hypothetical protein
MTENKSDTVYVEMFGYIDGLLRAKTFEEAREYVSPIRAILFECVSNSDSKANNEWCDIRDAYNIDDIKKTTLKLWRRIHRVYLAKVFTEV